MTNFPKQDFLFGVGHGKLTHRQIKKYSAIAKRHRARFVYVHGNSGNCICGYGCSWGTCPILHYWFAAENHGAPFNQMLASDVIAEVGNE